jgi:hypothetical protein
MTVSSSQLQSADLQHPEFPRILVPDFQLLIFECTRLTFVPPDPIIVCPKSCLYPNLHIRRTFPASAAILCIIQQAYPERDLESCREDPKPNNN